MSENNPFRDKDDNLIDFDDLLVFWAKEAILDLLGDEPDSNTQGGIAAMTCPDIIARKAWGELVEYELSEMETEGLVKKLPYQDEDVWCLAENYEAEIAAMKLYENIEEAKDDGE